MTGLGESEEKSSQEESGTERDAEPETLAGVPSLMNGAILAALALSGLQAPQLDVTYAKVGDTELKLDFYPGSGQKAAPLIVWIHGGGWSGGSRKQAVPARRFQSLYPEYAVASIGYRLTREAIFPAQIEDCRKAVAWLRQNSEKLAVDPKRFAAWGSSAGGHLASMVGTINDWPSDQASIKGQCRVQAVVDYYGPTDLTALAKQKGFERHAQAGSAESRLLGGPVLELPAEAGRANPITYISPDDPPFFIVHGASDPVVAPSQSQLVHNALKAKGVQSELTLIPGAGHGGPQFIESRLMDQVHQFLARALSIK